MRFNFASVVLAALSFGQASAQVQVLGFLSNFDVYNKTGQSCNGFEIQLEGIVEADINHTWGNFHYGVGKISIDAASGRVYIRYNSTTAVSTPPSSVEHFGVVFNGVKRPSASNFTWTVGGAPVSTPVVIPVQTMVASGAGLTSSITNTTAQPVWYKRRKVRIHGRHVKLEELMPGTPVTNSGKQDANARRLRANERHEEEAEDLTAESETEGSSVTTIDVFEDNNGVPGAQIASVMNSTSTGNPTPCPATVTASGINVPAAGATNNAIVSAAPNCSWTASAAVPWITINSGAAVTGPGAVSYTVAANTAATPRAARVLIAGAVIQLVQSGTTPTQPFVDVPLTHPFRDHIALMRDNGVTAGCGSGKYCVDDTIVRGQMAVFMVRAVVGGDNFTYTTVPYFTDVAASHPYFKWIQKMRDLGVTTGCGNGKFCPDGPVTRGEMAVFAVRGVYGATFAYSNTPYFTDVPATHPYFSWIQKLKEVGITGGCGPTTYCPDAPNTRGQMAVFIVRGYYAGR